MITGVPETLNPQTAPRLTVRAWPNRWTILALKARWLARYPDAGLYADFRDFSLWRMRIGGALLVGDFARAARLRPADLLPGADAVAAIAEAEPSILAHCNGAHADALAAIAGAAGGGLGPCG